MVFLPIILALAGGQSIAAVLAGLSIAQWTAIAGELLGAAPNLVKAFADLHPALQGLTDIVAQRLPKEQISQTVVSNFRQWASLNPGAPYYKSDGSVGTT